MAALVLAHEVEPDEVVLAVCLDDRVAGLPRVRDQLERLARTTIQPLLQLRLLALDTALSAELAANPHIHAAVRSALALDAVQRAKLLEHASRRAALLARLPLSLPPGGHHPRPPTT